MFLTRRFYIAISSVILLFVAGFWWQWSYWTAFAALVLIAILFILEILLLYYKNGIDASRVCAHRFSNGDDNKIEVRVESSYRIALKLSVIDEAPVEGCLGYRTNGSFHGFGFHVPPDRRIVEIADGLADSVEYNGGSGTGAGYHGDPGKHAVFDLGVRSADLLITQRCETDHEAEENDEAGNHQHEPAGGVCHNVIEEIHDIDKGFIEEKSVSNHCKEQDSSRIEQGTVNLIFFHFIPTFRARCARNREIPVELPKRLLNFPLEYLQKCGRNSPVYRIARPQIQNSSVIT